MRSPNHIHAPLGIEIHFCVGAHVIFPTGNNVFQLKVTSLQNRETVFDGEVRCRAAQPVEFKTRQAYFVPWKIEIRRDGKFIYCGECTPAGRKVLINMLPGAFGDMIAWMPAVSAFAYTRNAKVTVLMKKEYIPLFDRAYPNITFTDNTQLMVSDFYAVYSVGVWGNLDFEPVNFQKSNLVMHAAGILGVTLDPKKPPLISPVPETKEKGPYVCIATRASKKMKEWNAENGWKEVVAFLKNSGYRVLCIDADNKNLPEGAEDFTGKRPLMERFQLLRGCGFFIGLPSGLSWLAWAAEKPVVLISGCTEKFTEFATPYHVSGETGCHGCYNAEDMRSDDYNYCPRGKDFECTRVISAKKVISAIKKIPEFKKTAAER